MPQVPQVPQPAAEPIVDLSDEALFGSHCPQCDKPVAGTMGALCDVCMGPPEVVTSGGPR